MSYSRDSSKDLVYDPNSGQYIIPSKPEHLYSWKKFGKMLSGNDIVYTASATPSVGDLTYNADGISTGYTVKYIINSQAISLEDCIVILKVAPRGFDYITVTIDNVTTNNTNGVILTSIGKTINYTVIKEGYPLKTGTLTTSSAYQVVDIDLSAANKEYSITYNNEDYTAVATEGKGLIINSATKTGVFDLGTDFVVTENS